VLQAGRHLPIQQIEGVVVADPKSIAVEVEEHVGTQQGRSLVAVDQGLVLRHGMQQSCCLLGQRWVRVSTEDGCPRSGQRR
jgi:hypothetical protein